MRDGSLSGDLGCNDGHTTTERDEDTGGDEQGSGGRLDCLVLNTESEDTDGQTCELLILVSVEVSLSETSEEGEEAQTDSKDVGEVGVVLGVEIGHDEDE